MRSTFLAISFLFIYFIVSAKSIVHAPDQNSIQDQSININGLRCEYLTNPVGIDVVQPRLFWKLKVGADEKNVMQTAYRIQVAIDENFKKDMAWDSGKVMSDKSTHVVFEGSPLQSRKRYFWRVKVWDNKGRESKWSEPAFWEMGLLEKNDWKAKWISAAWEEEEKAMNPSPMMRHEFPVPGEIASARMYITSHGLYRAMINGKNITEDLFTPGWTSYQHRIQYQTYDVTDLLKKGENTIGVVLGDGWYRGQFGFRDNWNIYGKKLALLCQIEITYNGGGKDIIITDTDWKATTGPIIYSSIYDGEYYDARKEHINWSSSSFNDGQWQNVIINEGAGYDNLIAPQGPPVRKMMTVEPIDIITTPGGDVVVDFGQNMVGWVKLSVNGAAGDMVELYHAEVLDKEGNFYTANLRSAEQKITYILKGGGMESFEPSFTFQGFRYVKVVGFPGQLTKSNLEGIVVYSDMENTGYFECSDSLVNQLQSNILWGQRGNFLDVPTDCPQRDERMGWTGDAQAFAPTACYNFDASAFFTKWLGDLSADQKENGSVPFVVPDVLGAGGSTGWGDAATIIPWTLYLKYGDTRILDRQYSSMKKWVEYLKNLAGEDLIIQDGFHFGDWLFFIHPTDWNAKPGYSDIDFLSTAFLAYSADIVRKAAGVLGKKADSLYFQKLFDEVKESFQHEFITSSGRISPHSQTAYTLAVAFGLLKDEQIPRAIHYLADDIEKRNYHLSTGFLGTPHLCKVLSDHGRTDLAYRLLLQKSYPSWLYPVTRGATTIWERWDGIKPDSSFQTTQMNSFNHYAYGAIGHWLYSEVTGIDLDESHPGYKHIIIDPHIDPSLSFARSGHESMYGEIYSAWSLNGSQLNLEVSVPPNTTATIHLPFHPDGDHNIVVGSGIHRFNYNHTMD